MCDNGIAMLGKGDTHWVYLRTSCKSWHCVECASAMQALHAAQARHGAAVLRDRGYELLFVTLTSHEHVRTLDAGLRVWRTAWPRLRARLDRAMHPRKPRSPRQFVQIGTDYQYVLVPELHADGALHVHAIIALRGRMVGVRRIKRWTKDNARACGLGYQADVIRIRTPQGALRYVVKYLSKAQSRAGGFPKRTRRVSYSQGWPRLRVREVSAGDYDWEVRPALELAQALSLAMRAGVDLYHQGQRVTTDLFL